MNILNALALVSVILLLAAVFRRRIEETIPAAIGCWMFLLLLLAVLRHLLWIDIISAGIVLACVVLLLWRVATGRLTVQKAVAFATRQVLTPGLLAAVILCGVFLWGCSAREVYHPDEIQYWGTFTRSLWVSNGFVDAQRHCTPLYATYAPGMQLMQWSIMHMTGGWHESLMYSVLFFCNASFLLPLLADVRWRQWWKAMLFVALVVVVPTCLTSSYYAILATDGTLGMLFGLSLVLLARGRFGGFERFLLAVALGTMVMVKESGVATVLLAGLFVALSQPEGCKKAALSAFWAPLICFILWRGYCSLNGLSGRAGAQIASTITAAISGNWSLPLGFAKVATLFVSQLATTPGNLAGWWGGSVPLAGLPTLGWFLLFAVVPALLWKAYAARPQRMLAGGAAGLPAASVSPWRLAIFPMLVLLCYIASMLLTFLTAFAPELPTYANGHQSIAMVERYGAPFLMGLLLLSLELLRAAKLPRGWSGVLSVIALLMVVCFTNWAHLQNFVPAVYRQRFPDRVQADKLRQEAWLAAVDDPAQTRILSLTDALVDARMYALPPISFVGMPDAINGMYDSLPALYPYLKVQGITHVRVDIRDPALRAKYSELFETPLENGALYRLRWEQGTAALLRVFPASL